jgi:hypothetical protein
MKLSFGAACRRPIQMATTTELGGVGLKFALSADPCVLGECNTKPSQTPGEGGGGGGGGQKRSRPPQRGALAQHGARIRQTKRAQHGVQGQSPPASFQRSPPPFALRACTGLWQHLQPTFSGPPEVSKTGLLS